MSSSEPVDCLSFNLAKAGTDARFFACLQILLLDKRSSDKNHSHLPAAKRVWPHRMVVRKTDCTNLSFNFLPAIINARSSENLHIPHPNRLSLWKMPPLEKHTFQILHNSPCANHCRMSHQKRRPHTTCAHIRTRCLARNLLICCEEAFWPVRTFCQPPLSSRFTWYRPSSYMRTPRVCWHHYYTAHILPCAFFPLLHAWNRKSCDH